VAVDTVPLPEPEPPASCVQVFAGEHVYRFWPGVFAVLKNISPGLQAAGNVVPDFAGMVDAALEKSTFLVCVRRSTKFWPFRDESSQSRLTNWYFFTKLKSFVKNSRACPPTWRAGTSLTG
jgi:hypothetical protein